LVLIMMIRPYLRMIIGCWAALRNSCLDRFFDSRLLCFPGSTQLALSVTYGGRYVF
jgi:hypothetical protein